MKNIKVLITALLLFASVGMVQAQSKIAHINSAKLMEQLPAVKEAQKKIEAETTKYQEILGRMETQIKQLEAAIQNPQISELEKEIKLQEYQDAVKRYQTTQATAQESLQKMQNELYNPIIENLKKTITEVAKAKGYDYVLDSAEGGILIYGNESYNLMADVKLKLGIQ